MALKSFFDNIKFAYLKNDIWQTNVRNLDFFLQKYISKVDRICYSNIPTRQKKSNRYLVDDHSFYFCHFKIEFSNSSSRIYCCFGDTWNHVFVWKIVCKIPSGHEKPTFDLSYFKKHKQLCHKYIKWRFSYLQNLTPSTPWKNSNLAK